MCALELKPALLLIELFLFHQANVVFHYSNLKMPSEIGYSAFSGRKHTSRCNFLHIVSYSCFAFVFPHAFGCTIWDTAVKKPMALTSLKSQTPTVHRSHSCNVDRSLWLQRSSMKETKLGILHSHMVHQFPLEQCSVTQKQH